jgi:hypothetical protein
MKNHYHETSSTSLVTWDIHEQIFHPFRTMEIIWRITSSIAFCEEKLLFVRANPHPLILLSQNHA